MKLIQGEGEGEGAERIINSQCSIQIELNVQTLIYAEYIPYSSIALECSSTNG